FVLPHHRALRPAFLIRLGLLLYDHLGGRKLLPASRSLDLRRDPAGAALKPEFTRGFEYSDCWVEDARLVVLNAADAAQRGADIRVRTEVTAARRAGDRWRVELTDSLTGQVSTAEARCLVNAAGPWVAEVIARTLGLNSKLGVRLVKGSHIVIKRIFDHDRAYILQNADRRIVFAIPYERDFTLIGTTDIDFNAGPGEVEISAEETAYLCKVVSDYFKQPVVPEDVVWSYSGVRPLFDEGGTSAQETTRDFVLERSGEAGEAPLLNIFGGKITTYRYLAEQALKKLADRFPEAGPAWTAGAGLPGGDFPVDGFESLVGEISTAHPYLAPGQARRLCRAYGTRVRGLLEGAESLADLGIDFGGGLTQREVEYLCRREWAVRSEDILWRRSKLGLRLSEVEKTRLAEWLQGRSRAQARAAK
ncbi:MAG: glycerol-3-phosphate dehydrogenase, partial [Rhodovibrionaceae bacterium]